MRTLLAQWVMAAHAAVIVFNVLGPIWCYRRPRWRVAHLASLGLTLLFFAGAGRCPLTDLENALRGGGPPGGFIERRLERFVYWDVRPGHVGLASGVWFAVWAVAYERRWRQERSRSR